MHIVEGGVREGQTLQHVRGDEAVGGGHVQRSVALQGSGGHDIHAYDTCLRKPLSHLGSPAPRTRAHVENVARVRQGRRIVAAQGVAQHVVLEVEPVNLFHVLGEQIRDASGILAAQDMIERFTGWCSSAGAAAERPHSRRTPSSMPIGPESVLYRSLRGHQLAYTPGYNNRARTDFIVHPLYSSPPCPPRPPRPPRPPTSTPKARLPNRAEI